MEWGGGRTVGSCGDGGIADGGWGGRTVGSCGVGGSADGGGGE